MSLTFTGSAYSNFNSNVLVSLSNQTGSLTLNIPPSANFLARYYLYQGSNATGRGSNTQFSFGDTPNRMSVNINGANLSFYESSNLLASCNITPVYNSNVEVAFMDDATGLRIYYNKLNTISYASSNYNYSSNANFKWEASNASSNLISINSISIEPILTFLNNSTFSKSVRVMSAITANTVQSSNITGMSNYLYSLSNSTTIKTLSASNTSSSNYYFTSNTIPLMYGTNNSIIQVIGNTSNDYYRFQKSGGVDILTIQASTTNVGTFTGTLNASTLQEGGTSLVSKYGLSNSWSNYVLTTTANTTYAPSNTMSNYLLSSTALTSYALSNSVANYLPLAGGIMTGNVGMGITPAKNIHINHNTDEVGIRIDGGSNGTSSRGEGYFTARSNKPVCLAYANKSLYIGRATNGGDITGTTQSTLVLTTADLIGVGTSTPSSNYKIEVNGALNATTIYESSNALSTKYAGLSAYNSLSNYTYNLSTSNSVIQNIYTSNINATGGGTIGSLVASAGALGVAGYALFQANGNLANDLLNNAGASMIGAFDDKLRSTGMEVGRSATDYLSFSNVGNAFQRVVKGGATVASWFIDGGIQVPYAKLGVGTITVSNDTIAWTSNTTSNLYMSSNSLLVQNNSPFTFSTSSEWIFTGSTTFNNELKISGSKLYMYYTDTSNAYHGLSIGPAQLQICTASSNNNIGFGYTNSNSFYEKMRIGGNGFVGIGTNNPTTELEVNGGIKSSSLNSTTILSSSISSSNISSPSIQVGNCSMSGGSFTMQDYGNSSSFTQDIFVY